jgi:hypothetical protein
MAAAWGADPTPTGKVVWFELRPGASLEATMLLDAQTIADLAEMSGGSFGGFDGAASAEHPNGLDGWDDRIESCDHNWVRTGV